MSDDWWQGKTADGRVGLFPGMFLPTFLSDLFIEVVAGTANYVELHQ